MIEKLEEILKLLDDAETGQRGYVITGEPRYLEPYHSSRAVIDQRLREVRYLTRDNPRQQHRLDRLPCWSTANNPCCRKQSISVTAREDLRPPSTNPDRSRHESYG